MANLIPFVIHNSLVMCYFNDRFSPAAELMICLTMPIIEEGVNPNIL